MDESAGIGGFGNIDDVEAIVGRVIRTIVAISRRVSRFASRIVIGAVVICVGSFLLGMAALDGGIQTVWAVLGIVFAAIAIGNALIGWWGVRRIRSDVPKISSEVRGLITEGRSQGALVLRQFDEQFRSGDDVTVGGSTIFIGRTGFGLRGLAGQGLESAGRLTAAVQSVTRFPLMALTSVLITLVFAFLGCIFLLALAL